MDINNNQLLKEFNHILTLPHRHQFKAVEDLRKRIPLPQVKEIWNTAMGSGSLYDAWSATSIMEGLYAQNRQLIRQYLDALQSKGVPFRIVEIGGGNGRLWQLTLTEKDQGRLIVVDPNESAHQQVSNILPKSVQLTSVVKKIEDVDIKSELGDHTVDIIVCSLTLHHLPGYSIKHLQQHGVKGFQKGKLEVLSELKNCLKPAPVDSANQFTHPFGILNEADMYSDITLPPNDEVLLHNVSSSYWRRAGFSVAQDVQNRTDVTDDMNQRWLTMLRLWFIDQIDVTSLPLEQRDVYELGRSVVVVVLTGVDVAHWLEIFADAGLKIVQRKFTDDYLLFYQYVFVAPHQ